MPLRYCIFTKTHEFVGKITATSRAEALLLWNARGGKRGYAAVIAWCQDT